MHLTRNQTYLRGYRGFESLSVRHKFVFRTFRCILENTETPAMLGFCAFYVLARTCEPQPPNRILLRRLSSIRASLLYGRGAGRSA